MKSNKIDESQTNYRMFIELIKKLKDSDIKRIGKVAEKIEDNDNILKRAFAFFYANKISDSDLTKELKVEFSEERLIEINSKEESEEKQILINILLLWKKLIDIHLLLLQQLLQLHLQQLQQLLHLLLLLQHLVLNLVIVLKLILHQ
jgi:hypothetical protein